MASRARQFLLIILVWVVLLASAGNTPAAVRYTIAPISPSTSNSYLQDFNDSGRVAFLSDSGGKKVVMTYRAGDLDQLSSGATEASYVQMNKAGDTVWVADGKKIHSYSWADDTVSEIKLSYEPGAITNLKINDKGAMVWGDGHSIILYKDGKEEIIGKGFETHNYDEYSGDWWSEKEYHDIPQINNINQVVWEKYYEYSWTMDFESNHYVCLYSNGKVTDFSTRYRAAAQLNDSGHMVWPDMEWSESKRDYEYEIFYYDGVPMENISQNDDYDDSNPQINPNGQVVWQGKSKATGHTDIFLWDKGVVTNLSNTPDYDEANPVINSLGMVAWNGFDGHDQEIYLYYKDKIQLTKNYGYNDTNPLINARGEIAWDAAPVDTASTVLKNAVYLAKPLADTYTYYYKYGSGGDYYSGTVYANPGIPYYLGYMFNKKNETGETGYYKISGFDYTGDFSLYGQVTVDKYYDAESKRSFKPVHAGQAVGTNYLGSELAYVGVDGVSEYQFGRGYYEADVYDTFTFRYTYGNGDWYQGIVYRNPAEEYYQGWKAVTRNELKVDGYYEILAMAYTGKTAQYKKVFVTRYYDGETKKYLTLVPPATGYSGNNLLLSEAGYVISATATHYFGKGYYEADE